MALTKFGEKLELRSEVELKVPPEVVWCALIDLPRHGQWNPFWSHVRGRIEAGGRVDLDVTPPGGTVMRVRRRIQLVEPSLQLAWSGGYGWGWLLRSEQFFRLSERSSGCTRLVVGENLRGPGVTGKNDLVMHIARGQALMNQALKRFLEESR